MKIERRIVIVVLALLTGVIVGCGRSREEVELERKRMELAEQAQRDVQKASKAITEMNKKLGRKLEPLDLGLPPEKKTEPAPQPAQKP